MSLNQTADSISPTIDNKPEPSSEKKIIKKKRNRKLTYKQRAWVKEYIKNGGNGVRAALKVYDTKDYDTGRAISTENLLKPSIISAMEQHYDSHGLTKHRFAEEVAGIVLDKKIPIRDKSPYFRLYADTTPGVLAPTRTEQDTNINYTLEIKKTEAIIDVTRRALQSAQDV